MMRLISRDPFARQETLRVTVRTRGDCSWCGSPGRKGHLYRYDTVTDGGTTYTGARLFCCLSCRDSHQ
jgi:hypothetical protein